MKSLRPVLDLLALAWWRWASAEIDPQHEDVLKVALRRVELESGWSHAK